jgi:hypothetical protein
MSVSRAAQTRTLSQLVVHVRQHGATTAAAVEVSESVRRKHVSLRKLSMPLLVLFSPGDCGSIGAQEQSTSDYSTRTHDFRRCFGWLAHPGSGRREPTRVAEVLAAADYAETAVIVLRVLDDLNSDACWAAC